MLLISNNDYFQSNEDTQSKKSDKTDKSSKKGKGKKKAKAEEKTDRTTKTGLEPPELTQRPSRLAITPDNDESNMSLLGQDAASKLEPEYDIALYEFLDQIDASLSADSAPRGTLEQIKLIAEAIDERLGGKRTENYLIELIGLQRARESPIVPLGSITVGVYRERALLFKLVCDNQSIPVSLQRGK